MTTLWARVRDASAELRWQTTAALHPLGVPRDPSHPRQQQIAAHELGHAYTWLEFGINISSVGHAGDRGDCETTGYPSHPRSTCSTCAADPRELCAFAIGCWGGFEAEQAWCRQTGRGRANRFNSSYDIRQFAHSTYHYDRARGGLSEHCARALARDAVTRRWSDINARVPELIRNGTLTADDL